MPAAIYTHSHIYTLTLMCPAFADFVTKLFQIHDSISCCHDERDKIYRPGTKHCNIPRAFKTFWTWAKIFEVHFLPMQ